MKLREQCEVIGFKPETEKFADCVLRLVELDVKRQNQNQIVVAQNNEMHRRLIMPSSTGFLFSTDSDLEAILVEIENKQNREKIRKGAINYVQKYFTPQKHAQLLVDFFER